MTVSSVACRAVDPGHVAGAVATRARGGYWITRAPWGSEDGRARVMARYLDQSELAALAALAPAARDGRALGRLVVKEAVQRWLADRGASPVSLPEIRVCNDADGRPHVLVGGTEPVRVSLAHCRSTAVCCLATGRAGIDVEVVEARGSVFARLALTRSELRMGDAHDLDEWVTRLWTVKEAVAKWSGTGLRGRPKDIVVRAVVGDRAWVGALVVRSAREGDLVVSRVVPDV